MGRIFCNKNLSILFVALTLVVVMLACMLLVSLTQMASVKDRIERFEQLLAEAGTTIEERQALLEYLQSDEYVRKWAEDHNKLLPDDIVWLQENS